MVGVELYPPVYTDTFSFIMIKYVFGTSHHSLVPIAIILTRPDLRELIKVVFRKGKIERFSQDFPPWLMLVAFVGGSTQSKSKEMTYEEIQRQLGLGVEIN